MKMKFTKNLIKKKVVVLASHMLYYTCSNLSSECHSRDSRQLAFLHLKKKK